MPIWPGVNNYPTGNPISASDLIEESWRRARELEIIRQRYIGLLQANGIHDSVNIQFIKTAVYNERTYARGQLLVDALIILHRERLLNDLNREALSRHLDNPLEIAATIVRIYRR